MDHLKSLIREVPDFPKPGINFYDITTLLKHPEGLRNTVDALASEFEGEKVDSVIGIEARGFIFAPALAYHLGAGFVPVRKPRKLPAECAEKLCAQSRGLHLAQHGRSHSGEEKHSPEPQHGREDVQRHGQVIKRHPVKVTGAGTSSVGRTPPFPWGDAGRGLRAAPNLREAPDQPRICTGIEIIGSG